MIETIEHDGAVLAIVMRRDYEPAGVNFITAGGNPLQLGSIRLNRGDSLKPHVHRHLPRTIDQVHEVLHVEYGLVEVGFYTELGERTATTIIGEGDTILLMSGGHGFHVLEDTKMIEVKQGPYEGTDQDKRHLRVHEGLD